jgi:hypothetical protein
MGGWLRSVCGLGSWCVMTYAGIWKLVELRKGKFSSNIYIITLVSCCHVYFG